MEIELDNIISPSLPEEIIREILLRLPVKSLSRFRCVSKPWLCLISSHKFANAHLKVSNNNNKNLKDKLIFGPRPSRPFAIDLYTYSIRSIIEGSISEVYSATNDNNLLFNRVQLDYPYAGKNEIPQLVGSCNGLICVGVSPSIVILWNPTTRESKRLPHPGSELNWVHNNYSFGYESKRLGSELKWVHNNYSFGYDELHDDYKVVRFLSARYKARAMVYSLRTNSWKDVFDCPGEITSSRGPGKFLNGSLHWLVFVGTKRDIVSLDLATDTFARMLTIPDQDVVDVEVGIFGGCFGVYCLGFATVVLWVMKEYGVRESWTQVVQIPFLRTSFRKLCLADFSFYCPRPVVLLVDGKVLMNYGSSIKIYDPSNPQPHHFDNDSAVQATTYVESLVSLALDDEEEHD